MTRHVAAVLSLIAAGAVLSACSSAVPSQPKAPPPTPEAAPALEVEAVAKSDEPLPIAVLPTTHRRVGDLYVHRFSGTFSDTPMILREETVAKEGEWFVVDYQFEQATEKRHLRVRRHQESDAILWVSSVEKDGEVEVDRAAYEQLLERTAFAADENQGKVAKRRETCLVGEREATCTTTSFKVRVGGKPALLSLSSSQVAPGREVVGEVKSPDGTVFYRSELVEAHRGERPTSGVASR